MKKFLIIYIVLLSANLFSEESVQLKKYFVNKEVYMDEETFEDYVGNFYLLTDTKPRFRIKNEVLRDFLFKIESYIPEYYYQFSITFYFYNNSNLSSLTNTKLELIPSNNSQHYLEPTNTINCQIDTTAYNVLNTEEKIIAKIELISHSSENCPLNISIVNDSH